MARIKKSRKIGQIGTPKANWEPKKPKATQTGKPKKRKGNPSGSRQDMVELNSQKHGTGANKDPRIGSKKPISLVIEAKKDKPIKPVISKETFFTPAQELKALEENTRLSDLLDQLDEGAVLSNEDNRYVETQLARHKVLCELLGIGDEENEAEVETDNKDSQEDDLLNRFESIDINKFK
ncbi:Der GTPase-activating protein YihI [Aliiglaciecola sp. LCG003]|uniref:Der GTPase-activating protein YihI n=1 Tax=Aliiglaciecola sp. LCG003 TaxID=3053655 RepID=UPI002572A2A0|nr:Der GTPase-activating protein YihI [Aliiglaciecola sp. LCG003]WJG09468.1 Der GTPase-activating protein YihI [Aliiglaciecola sp. LCG003]